MSYTVRFAPQALEQLDAIEDYIAQAGSPVTAARYVDAIVAYCETLATFPQRGNRRPGNYSKCRPRAVTAIRCSVPSQR